MFLVTTMDGVRMEGVYEVKGVIKTFFEEKFEENPILRPILDRVQLKNLSCEKRDELEVEFIKEEIKEAVWDSEGDRSP